MSLREEPKFSLEEERPSSAALQFNITVRVHFYYFLAWGPGVVASNVLPEAMPQAKYQRVLSTAY